MTPRLQAIRPLRYTMHRLHFPAPCMAMELILTGFLPILLAPTLRPYSRLTELVYGTAFTDP
jgi:hypothetical protein